MLAIKQQPRSGREFVKAARLHDRVLILLLCWIFVAICILMISNRRDMLLLTSNH
jgi:hypothetical protein